MPFLALDPRCEFFLSGRRRQGRIAQTILRTLNNSPTRVLRVFGHDPRDDHIIGTTLAAQANLIGSSDRKHLRPLGTLAVTAS